MVQIGDINALHVDVDVGVGEDSCVLGKLMLWPLGKGINYSS